MPGLFIPLHVVVLPDDTIAAACWGRLWNGQPPSPGGVVFIDEHMTHRQVKFRAPDSWERPVGLAALGTGAVRLQLAGGAIDIIP